MKEYLDLLRRQFNDRVRFSEKRPGIYQLIAPFYHEDGDMIEVYLDNPEGDGKIRVSDHGMTIMRLSYEYDIDTPNKRRIFEKMLSENQLKEENGRIFLETQPAALYPAVLLFVQAVGKIANMRLFKREVISSLFYEMLNEFVMESLARFGPKPDVLPVPERDDLEVDYELQKTVKPVYIFGVRDVAKARLTTISCLEFQKAKIPHRSIVVHEDFESLTRKDRKRITSAADKQFVDLEDFKAHGEEFILRDAV